MPILRQPPKATTHEQHIAASSPLQNATECGEWIEANLQLVRSVIDHVCRGGRVELSERADFAAAVLLKLVDHDYAVLRRFDGRSSIRTFLYVVVRRQLLDWRDAKWGKWRPSVRARRLGAAAVDLERLTVRDGVHLREAVDILVTRRQWGLSSADFRGIHAQLPERPFHRRQMTPLHPDVQTAPDRADADVERGERRTIANKLSKALAVALASLQADDRRLLWMRFREDMSVNEIASALGADPARLYRRIAAVARQLRRRLEDRDLSISVVRPLLGHPEVSLAAAFALRRADHRALRAPSQTESRRGINRFSKEGGHHDQQFVDQSQNHEGVGTAAFTSRDTPTSAGDPAGSDA